MKNELLKELNERLLEEQGHITIGDASKTTLLKLQGKDATVENVLIGLYNMAKINQYKIEDLTTNLNLLATRVYDTNTDFTDEQKVEIEDSLYNMQNIKKLSQLNDFKDYLQDGLYSTEEDTELMIQKQNELMNKIKYPTQKMNKTFNDLVNESIQKNA